MHGAIAVPSVAAYPVSQFAGLMRSFGLVLVATMTFLLVLRLLAFARHLVLVRLRAHRARGLGQVTIAGFTLFTKDQIALSLRRLVDLLIWAAGVIVTYLWITFVFSQFAMSRPWSHALAGWLVDTLGRLALGALLAIPKLITVGIIVLIARFFTRLVTTFFTAVEAGTVELTWVHPDIAQPTRRLVTFVLWIFALVVAFPYIPGSDSQAFKGLSVFVGVMLSLGSTGLVNQAMSGLMLMYARALKPGEYVRIGDTEGTVVHVGLLSTGVRTTLNEIVTIPNAVVVTNGTMNFSRGIAAGLLLSTTVTIGYDTPWRQIHAMLIGAAGQTPGIGTEPATHVLQRALSDFYVEYELRAPLQQASRRIAVLSALNQKIQDVFNEHGVQIMSPHFRAQPERPLTVPRERWYAPPADTTDQPDEGSVDQRKT